MRLHLKIVCKREIDYKHPIYFFILCVNAFFQNFLNNL